MKKTKIVYAKSKNSIKNSFCLLTKEDVPFFFLCILSFFPLLPQLGISIVLILFCLSSLIFNYSFIKTVNTYNKLKPYLINTSFFILLIITLLYSSDKEEGLREIRRGLGLVTIPFFVFYSKKKINTLKVKFILINFVLASFIYVVYMYNFFVYKLTPFKGFNLRHETYLTKLIRVFNIPFNSILERAINVQYEQPVLFFHKAYSSMFICFSLVIVLFFMIKRRNKNVLYTIIKCILLLLFITVLIHWFSIPNILFLLTLPFIILYNKFRTIKQRLAISVCSLFFLSSMFFFVIYSNHSYTNKSISKNVNQLKNFIRSPFHSSLSARATINECSFDLIKKKILFGYGIGSEKQELFNCYKIKGFSEGVAYKLNTHNYFLHIFLSGGVLIFFIFFSQMGLNLWRSINENFIYACFLMLLILNMFSENILYRIHGVILFSIFNSILYNTFNSNGKSFNL